MDAYHRIYVTTNGWFDEGEGGAIPAPPEAPEVAGIFLGGCVAEGIGSQISRLPALAHAHTGRGDYRGWVCYAHPKYFNDPDHAWVLQHERAHVIANCGHTDRWRRVMRELGQPILFRNWSRKDRRLARELGIADIAHEVIDDIMFHRIFGHSGISL